MSLNSLLQSPLALIGLVGVLLRLSSQTPSLKSANNVLKTVAGIDINSLLKQIEEREKVLEERASQIESQVEEARKAQTAQKTLYD